MPTGARTQAATASPAASGPTSAHPAPLPFEQLLRSDGSGRPTRRHGLSRRQARAMLERDLELLLAARMRGAIPAAWHRPGFAARVRQVRTAVALLPTPELLADSLAREALVSRGLPAEPCPVRTGYALRWMELVDGVRPAAWEDWASPCAAARD